MRLSVFAALLMMLGAISANATNYFTEDFGYAAPSVLVGQGGWVVHSAGSNPHMVTAPGLTYAGFPGSGIGNASGPTVAGSTGEDVNHPFGPAPLTSTVYASAMVKVASATTGGDYFFHFVDGPPAGGAFKGRVFVKKDGTGALAFGIQFGSVAATVYTPFSYSVGTTYLLVLKYRPVVGALNDVASLFVNPTISSIEPPATVSHTCTATDVEAAAGLDAIALRQGGSTTTPSVTVDGIRVSDKWGDAGVPVELVQFSID